MFNAVSFIFRHPLTRRHPARALARFARWQIRSRLTTHKIAVPFVGETQLLVRRGMNSATGNIYCGLLEYQDMAFTLHALRPGDLFIDVGANVGTYTVLAAGVVGARAVSIEPSPVTFGHLQDNIRLNLLEDRVRACNVALGAKRDRLAFTRGLDTVDHIVSGGESAADSTTVDVLPLDELLAPEAAQGVSPTILKIDVEGFETEVIRGAAQTLRSPSLWAILMELNGSGARYGYDERQLHQCLLDHGFSPAGYDPMSRGLSATSATADRTDNTLYVRHIEDLSKRLREARRVRVNQAEF